MQQLEAMCAAVPPPDADTLARARARVLSAAGGPASGTSVPGRLALRRLGPRGLARRPLITVPRLALAGGLAVAAAAAVTAALVTTAPGPATRVRLDAAAVVLHRAAAAALAAPSPGLGHYVYIDIHGVGARGTNFYRQQMWLPATNGFHPGTVVQTPCNEFATGRPCALVDIQERGDFAEPTCAWVKTLPSAPGTLLTYLETHSLCVSSARHVDAPHVAYSEVYNILSSVYVLPPASGAALFNDSAKIPGITVLHHVTDAAGGQGIAVAMTGRATPAAPAESAPLGPVLRYELIFQPRTYRFIGLQQVTAEGTVKNAQAVISARVTDSTPKTDSHTPWGGLTPCIA